jgi:hypothetical protein
MREIRSREPPEDLYWRVVVQLSPLLEPAHYKLAAQDPQHVEYHRRYIPASLLVGAVVAIAVAGIVSAAVGVGPLSVLPGALALAALLGFRRREALTVSVHPRPGGSTAILRGYLSGHGRMALLGFDPPRSPRMAVPAGHRHPAGDVVGHPPVG